MSTSPNAATCGRCSTSLNSWTDACTHCGYAVAGSPLRSAAPGPGVAAPSAGSLVPAPPVAAAHPQSVVHVVPAKSPGIGVLLSFLWLGAGHLYIGNIGLGIGLIVFDFFLLLISLIPFVWILTFPVWLIAFIVVAVNVSKAAKAFNRRNGIVVH